MISTFNVRLKQVRLSKGLSRRQLSALSGVTEVTIMNCEMSKNGPSLDTAYRLAEALGTSLDYLSGLRPTATTSTSKHPNKSSKPTLQRRKHINDIT